MRRARKCRTRAHARSQHHTIPLPSHPQGKKLFGDGIGLWYTAHDKHKDGPLHGFTDTFKGFGIVLDTYVNTEPGHTHKDVQVVVSDGSAPKALDSSPIGCDADFRYWEGRDDFSVTRHSALRVRYSHAAVTAWIDPRADGNWKLCFENGASVRAAHARARRSLSRLARSPRTPAWP